MVDDAELLRQYCEQRSEAAFAELVRRHIDLVYSVAVRRTGGDAHRAQDAVQRVFSDLARKARLLARRPTLAGWLHRSAQYAATDLVRAECRRQAREAKAYLMHDSAAAPEPDWDEVRPLLDDALAELGDRDRDVLMMRYLEGLAFDEVGAALRISSDAARMRAERALEKLRAGLRRRGVQSTAAALSGAFVGQAATAAPSGVTAAVTTAVLASAAPPTAGLVVVGGELLLMTKLKAGLLGAVILAGMTTTIIEVRATRDLKAEYEARRARGEQLTRLQTENQRLKTDLATNGRSYADGAELVRLNERIKRLSSRPDGVVDSELRPFTNQGRSTYTAAFNTLNWALQQRDLALASTFVAFTDDTPENRTAFMRQLSPAIQNRYSTPELVCAAMSALLIGPGLERITAAQVLGATEDKGPDRVKLKVWLQGEFGFECAGYDAYVLSDQGWGPQPVSLADGKILKLALERLDPLTGDHVLPNKRTP